MMSRKIRWRDRLWLTTFSVLYLFSAFIWEKAMCRIVVWWGEQLWLLRPHLTTGQALEWALVAMVFVLVIIPHFLWFPVTLFKEMLYLLKLQPDPIDAPYVAAPYRYA